MFIFLKKKKSRLPFNGNDTSSHILYQKRALICTYVPPRLRAAIHACGPIVHWRVSSLVLFVTPPNIPPQKKNNIKKTFGCPLTLYFFTCAVVHVCSRAVEAIGHAIRSHNEDDGCRRPDGNVRALPAGGCVPWPPLKRRHHWQAPCSIVRFQHKLLAH